MKKEAFKVITVVLIIIALFAVSVSLASKLVAGEYNEAELEELKQAAWAEGYEAGYAAFEEENTRTYSDGYAVGIESGRSNALLNVRDALRNPINSLSAEVFEELGIDADAYMKFYAYFIEPEPTPTPEQVEKHEEIMKKIDAAVAQSKEEANSMPEPTTHEENMKRIEALIIGGIG